MKSSKLLLALMLAVPLLTNAADRLAYVLNSTGETLSKINLTTGIVQNDIVTIGSDIYSYPNQMVIRDSLAYIIASGTDELQIINLKSETTIDFISTGASSNPYWMAFYDSQFVYVTLMLQNKMIVIDVIGGMIVHQIPTGVSPAGIVISNNKAYVVCSGYDFENYTFNPSILYIYNLNDYSLLNQLDIGLNAQYAAVDNLGNIHIVATGNYFDVMGEVFIIDSGLDEIINSFSIGGSPGLINIGPDSVAYIAAAGWSQSGYIFSYNAITGELYHDADNPIEVGLNCMTAIAYQDSTIFAASFSTDYINMIDSAGTRLMDYAVGDGPIHLDFNYIPGDADGDFEVNILDVVHIINWKYKDGPATTTARWRANVNADMYYNILDIVYLLNYLYKDGPAPKVGIPWLL